MAGELADVMGAMAEGDLGRSVRGDYRGVFGQLKGAANGMAERLRDFAGRLTETARAVHSASSEHSTGRQALPTRTERPATPPEGPAPSAHRVPTTVKANGPHPPRAHPLEGAANP